MKSKCAHRLLLLLLLALPALLCRCGGGAGSDAGENGNEDPKENENQDSAQVAKAANFPKLKAGGEIPAELESLMAGKTWGEVIETVSDEPPVWKTENLEGETGHTGVRATLAMRGDKGSILFKVAHDGSAVTPLQVLQEGDIVAEDPEEIAEGLAGFYSMKSKDFKGPSLVRTRAITTKNLNVLKQFAIGARMAALENTGTFPDELAEIRKAGEIPDDEKLINPATDERVDPIYFSGLDDASDGNLILLAAPFESPDGKRSVAFVNGIVKHIPEDEYQANAAKQKQE